MSGNLLEEQLKALSHQVRRDILSWLKQPELYFADQTHPLSLGVCAGKIEQKIGLSQSTVSAHLAVLQRAGFIQGQKIGQWIFYSRNEAVLATFLAGLQQQL